MDASLNATRGRPLDGPDAWLRYAPWLVAGLIACLSLPLLPSPGIAAQLALVGLLAIFLLTATLVPWERLPDWPQALPALIPFAMVVVVRTSIDSAIAPYTPVVLLPVIWFALYGTRTQLLIAVLCVGLAFAFPSPAVGDGGYPATVPVAALLWMIIAGISGFAISELVRQREALTVNLNAMARTDVLTGLPNRRAWDEALEREVAMANRTGSPVCVALLDLDHFKQFNDLNGHPAGDMHLRQAASAWRARLRSADLVARYGGEEFAVLLTATEGRQAHELIEMLRACVPSDETVSAGIAEWNGIESAGELLKRADRALYEAKRNGRNRTVAIHSPRLASPALEPDPA